VFEFATDGKNLRLGLKLEGTQRPSQPEHFAQNDYILSQFHSYKTAVIAAAFVLAAANKSISLDKVSD
jgi:hypothetical protein